MRGVVTHGNDGNLPNLTTTRNGADPKGTRPALKG